MSTVAAGATPSEGYAAATGGAAGTVLGAVGAAGEAVRRSDGRAKPSGQYADEMTGPGSWPETDESEFDRRKEVLAAAKSQVSAARITWDSLRAMIFNGAHVWAGKGASAAATAAERSSDAMADCEKRLDDAMQVCENASRSIGVAKDFIIDNVSRAAQSRMHRCQRRRHRVYLCQRRQHRMVQGNPAKEM